MKKGKLFILKQLTIINLLLLTTSCSIQHKKLIFKNYSNLTLGFTTQNFIGCLPVTLENSKMLLDYAAKKGFRFFELRDPDAVLTFEECTDIANYACEKDIEVAYSNQRGLLDPDFWDIFNKGIKNATVFSGPKTIRATLSGINFTENPGKVGLCKDELTKAVEIANHAAQIAEKQGMQLVIENGNELFVESIDSIYGFESFFKQVNQNVDWQFDTGNPFANKNSYVNPNTVKQYLENHVGQIKYIHLKSAQNRKAQKILCKNDLDFNTIFAILSSNHKNFISIELLLDSVKNTVFENMDKSLEYLRIEGYIK
jgi:sugar phosphate isomerase/epimerase